MLLEALIPKYRSGEFVVFLDAVPSLKGHPLEGHGFDEEVFKPADLGFEVVDLTGGSVFNLPHGDGG